MRRWKHHKQYLSNSGPRTTWSQLRSLISKKLSVWSGQNCNCNLGSGSQIGSNSAYNTTYVRNLLCCSCDGLIPHRRSREAWVIKDFECAYETWGCSYSEDVEIVLMENSNAWNFTKTPAFRGNILPPFSWLTMDTITTATYDAKSVSLHVSVILYPLCGSVWIVTVT